MESWRLLQYFLYFRDLHNFHMSIEQYASLFRKEFLDGGYIRPTPINLNNVYLGKPANRINSDSRLATRKIAETWLTKHYPKTVEENKQIFDDYLSLCEENEIKPIVFTPPQTRGAMEAYPKKLLDEFHTIRREIMSRHPTAVFFDGWQVQGFVDDVDFCDSIHLNTTGAVKFSRLFNQFIMQFERK